MHFFRMFRRSAWRFFGWRRGAVGGSLFDPLGSSHSSAKNAAQLLRHIVIDRT